jgi:ubiquinone/menaquinone biosynthesis C-methylase UbiE
MDPKTPELERLTTDSFNFSSVEHLHRYAVAAELCAGKDVLDVASGEGYGTNVVASRARSVTGVDVSSEAIAQAQRKYRLSNARFVQGRADDLPLDDASVDIVVSFETLEHHDRHEEMLFEIKRVLRPNGLLIMSTPDKRYYSDIPGYRNEYHVKELYTDEFRSLVQRHFVHSRLLFQGMVFGTLVAPERGWGVFSSYGGDFGQCINLEELTEHEYNIAIASDGSLPEIGVSLFNASHLSRDFEGLLKSQETTIANLRGSLSYRLGRALTWPVRKLRGRG